MMKRLLVLSVLMAALSALAIAAPLGACVDGVLSTYLGNSCTIGDKMFDNLTYTGNVAASNVIIDFQVQGNEYHLILAPALGFGLFQTLSFTDRITVLAGVAPNIPPAAFQIIAVKDQGFFSAVAGSAGSLVIANTPGPTYNLAPGNELGGPTFITPTNTVTTVSTLSGGNPGLSSLELDYLQGNTAAPEPATIALIGLGLLALSAGIRSSSRTQRR
jgi:hypothetical protein